jgi:hypothetical protein
MPEISISLTRTSNLLDSNYKKTLLEKPRIDGISKTSTKRVSQSIIATGFFQKDAVADTDIVVRVSYSHMSNLLEGSYAYNTNVEGEVLPLSYSLSSNLLEGSYIYGIEAEGEVVFPSLLLSSNLLEGSYIYGLEVEGEVVFSSLLLSSNLLESSYSYQTVVEDI